MSQSNKITISQHIELVVNDNAIIYFRKGFGCAKLVYNLGLVKMREHIKYIGKINNATIL